MQIAASRKVNPAAVVVRAASPVTLLEGPDLAGARVLVVEDDTVVGVVNAADVAAWMGGIRYRGQRGG